MEKQNVFDIASMFFNKKSSLEEPHDACILFSNGEYFFVHTCVLKQLQFFNNILLDLPNCSFCKHNDLPIMLECNTALQCINQTSFSFLYNHLRNRYLGCIGFINSPLVEYNDQINYIKTIDYLTDPNERDNLLSDIKWTEAFWINIVVLKYPNLHTFFDRYTLDKGCQVCIEKLAISNSSPEFIEQLRSFFGVKYPPAEVGRNGHLEVLKWFRESGL